MNQLVVAGLWEWLFGQVKKKLAEKLEEGDASYAAMLRDRYIGILEGLGKDEEAAKLYAATTDPERAHLAWYLGVRGKDEWAEEQYTLDLKWKHAKLGDKDGATVDAMISLCGLFLNAERSVARPTPSVSLPPLTRFLTHAVTDAISQARGV